MEVTLTVYGKDYVLKCSDDETSSNIARQLTMMVNVDFKKPILECEGSVMKLNKIDQHERN